MITFFSLNRKGTSLTHTRPASKAAHSPLPAPRQRDGKELIGRLGILT